MRPAAVVEVAGDCVPLAVVVLAAVAVEAALPGNGTGLKEIIDVILLRESEASAYSINLYSY